MARGRYQNKMKSVLLDHVLCHFLRSLHALMFRYHSARLVFLFNEKGKKSTRRVRLDSGTDSGDKHTEQTENETQNHTIINYI